MVKKFHWTLLSPIFAWILYFSRLIEANTIFQIVASILLIASVLAAVHHSEVIAHKVGEPFGTIILALAITVIEVAIIISIMIAGGNEASALARDTVFAAIMLILNGIIGVCLLIGGYKHYEQFFSKHSTNTALVSLVAIIVLTLVLPNYTSSIKEPFYSQPQMMMVSVSCLALYGGFLLTQTIRHREYFLDGDQLEHQEKISTQQAWVSMTFLILALGIVVLLAKKLSPTIEAIILNANLPISLVGVVIAAIILLPEGIAALKAARKNKLQSSLNLALGSALASIGLTIPSVVIISSAFDLPLVFGLDMKSMILLMLSIFTVMLSLSKGRSNMLYGIVLIVNLFVYLFTIVFP